MVGTFSKLSAKVIEKAVTEVSKQQQFTNLPQGESPFQQVLNTMSDGGKFAADIGVGQQQMGLPSNDVNAISANGIDVDIANLGVGLDKPGGMTRVVDMLSEVNRGHMKMEGMVNQIIHSGKKFSNQELLAIQAQVFHFAQITELVVKAADQGVSSIKAILNTNIQ